MQPDGPSGVLASPILPAADLAVPRVFVFVSVVVTVLVLAACAEPSSAPPPSDPASDSVFALLGRLDTSVVAGAFRALEEHPHRVTTWFEVRDGDGLLLGEASRTVERTPTQDGITLRVLRADSSGTLRDGAFAPRLVNPLPTLLPDDPAYLALQTREHYRYHMAPDTSIDGQRFRVVEVRLATPANDELAIRHARYLLAPDSEALRGVAVDRRLTSVLFDEANQAEVILRLGPDGRLVPWSVSTTAQVDTPGAAPQQYRLWHRIDVDSTQVVR